MEKAAAQARDQQSTGDMHDTDPYTGAEAAHVERRTVGVQQRAQRR